jgi:hypothetical protein
MKRHPTQGVKGAKPRLKSLPPASTDSQTDGELSREYLIERNAAMRAKRLTAEMTLAQRRGQLIDKGLASRQAAYLLINLRQKMLALPAKMRTKFGESAFPLVMRNALKSLIHDALKEAARLPAVSTVARPPALPQNRH